MLQKTYHITGFSDGNFEAALAEAAALSAYQNAAQVLLTVFEQNWDEAKIRRKLHLIREAVPKAEIAGITHYDKLLTFEQREVPEHSVLSFLFFEAPAFSLYRYPTRDCPDAEAGRQLNAAIRARPDCKGAMAYCATPGHNLDTLLEKAGEGVPDIPIFGGTAGLAGGPAGEPLGYVFDGDGVYRDTMLVVLFHGENLHLKASYNYGWTPIGKTMTITATDGDFCVAQIDGRPAADVCRQYLGLSPALILSSNVCEFPLIVDRGGMTVARIPLSCERGGRLRFGAALRAGETIRFSYGAQQRIFSEIYEDAAGFLDVAPQGMFLTVCMNRLIFLKEDEHLEVDYYRRITPELAILHGNSELYHCGGAGGELNSALVAVGIWEGVPEKRHIALVKDSFLGDRASMNFILPLEYRVMTFLTAVTADLMEMTEQANAANKAKSNFLSNMSHEIRTPINAVLGMDEMILRESGEEPIRAYAADIRNAGNTLLSLINDILDLSKIESGKLELVPVRYDLSSVLHDLIQMILLRAKNKDLEFRVRVAEDLPTALFGDDVRLRQVLTNILTNAVKYTEQGSVTMRVSGERSGKKVRLHCEVEDTGIGIKEEDMPKLFDAFERIEEQRNRSIEGTGLGMNITQRLLRMMDSKLEVESVYGKGSRFWFDVEQEIVDDTPIGDFDERVRRLADGYHYERSFTAPEANILVVDDNELNLRVFVNLLKQTQVRITTAQSGKEALGLAAKEHYDIIFLDHMMPDMDGVETMKRLKAMTDGPNAATPVYALTANAVAGAKESYLAAGFDGFLAKPIDAAKLEQTIADTLPAELLRDAPARQANTAASDAADELPTVEGLDWAYASLHLPERELLLDALRGFYDMLEPQAQKLQAFRDANDIEGYRIQVHGMKSAAATVGVTLLSGMANRLEFAARDADAATIDAMHGVFLASWRGYREKLAVLFPSEDAAAGDKPPAAENLPRILARLEMLKTAMATLDLDTADTSMEELLTYAYPTDAEEAVLNLKAAVAALDAEQTASLADKLSQLLQERRAI